MYYTYKTDYVKKIINSFDSNNQNNYVSEYFNKREVILLKSDNVRSSIYLY